MQPTAGLFWGGFYPGNRLWLIPGLLLDPPWGSFILISFGFPIILGFHHGSFIVNGLELPVKIPITYKWDLLILFFLIFTPARKRGSQRK